jgi:hypothetical protein
MQEALLRILAQHSQVSGVDVCTREPTAIFE